MLFNSLEYFALLAITVPLYWCTRRLALRQAILLIASIVFYCSWLPSAVVLLMLAVALNWACAMQAAGGNRNYLVVAVVTDLAILGVYKYSDFAIANVNAALSWAGSATLPQLGLILPLGISFYVFQLIAYTVDVYRRTVEPERNLLLLLLFSIFFPHLVAGPITRPSQLLPPLKTLHSFDPKAAVRGCYMIASGLFLKVAIADNLAPHVNPVFANPSAFGFGDTLTSVLCFGVQIFCDFWGYSTMAVGSALLFGIGIPQNFNLPYAAVSLRDFWRRWHITLSNWLRDYLFIPLGGSRKGKVRTSLNLIAVMGLGGLWHGANWTFIAWGLLHGGWLALERAAVHAYASTRPSQLALERLFWLGAGWAVTMLVVFVGWVFFRAPSLGEAMTILGRFGGAPTMPSAPFREAWLVLALFAAVHVPIHWLNRDHPHPRVTPTVHGIAVFWLILAAIVLGSGSVTEFIYFQF